MGEQNMTPLSVDLTWEHGASCKFLCGSFIGVMDITIPIPSMSPLGGLARLVNRRLWLVMSHEEQFTPIG